MARIPRSVVSDVIYHILNRANGRETIFRKEKKKTLKYLRKFFLKVKKNYKGLDMSFKEVVLFWKKILGE